MNIDSLKIPAQGASRAVGGFARQHALGNHPNIGDIAESMEVDESLVVSKDEPKGVVALYDTFDPRPAHLDKMDQTCVMYVNVSFFDIF